MNTVRKHYDILIENGNNPVLDSKELSAYMDKYDGNTFINSLCLDMDKTVFEIGCGTGRIAKKIVNHCKKYVGIDISPKTIEVAKNYFKNYRNVFFINENFLEYDINQQFDIVCSTLTFMHIREKKKALNKVFNLLKSKGLFVLSIDKNQQNFIDTGYSKIKVYPDNPTSVCKILKSLGFINIQIREIELSFIIKAYRN